MKLLGRLARWGLLRGRPALLAALLVGVLLLGVLLTGMAWAQPSSLLELVDVTIDGVDGAPLAATLALPAEQPAPGVLLLHMLGSNRHAWDPFMADLARAGYAVLALDLRGHGDSAGPRDWAKAPDDVLLAWRYLTARPEVDASRSALIGASIGANVALVAAADEPAIRTVVLLSPGLDYRGVTTEAAVEALGARPLLIVAAEGDSYAANSSRVLAALARDERTELLLYDGNAHGTNLFAARGDLPDVLIGWLERTLFEAE